MEDWKNIWVVLVVIGIYIFKIIWDKIREKIPVILRKIICFAAYGIALYVYIFYYDDWFVKLLGILFVPFATCLLLFGRWKEWSSFREFIKDFYQSDGLFFMSVFVIVFWVMFML